MACDLFSDIITSMLILEIFSISFFSGRPPVGENGTSQPATSKPKFGADQLLDKVTTNGLSILWLKQVNDENVENLLILTDF